MSKHDIFQIMNDYHSDNEILKSEAKKAVIEDYSKFVSYIIKEKFYSYRKHWEDLFQCGICGLLKALENYDPHFSKPTTYFYYFIVQEINDFISKYIEGTNRYYSRKVKSLDESILKLKRSGIPEPSARELAKVMNLKETSARNLILFHDHHNIRDRALNQNNVDPLYPYQYVYSFSAFAYCAILVPFPPHDIYFFLDQIMSDL